MEASPASPSSRSSAACVVALLQLGHGCLIARGFVLAHAVLPRLPPLVAGDRQHDGERGGNDHAAILFPQRRHLFMAKLFVHLPEQCVLGGVFATVSHEMLLTALQKFERQT